MRNNQKTRNFGISAWVAPTLLNSWVNYGSIYTVAGYCKDSNGLVYLRGLVKTGLSNTVVFTLPTGFRPTAELLFVTVSNNAFAQINVAANGDVTAKVSNSTWLSLNISPFSAK